MGSGVVDTVEVGTCLLIVQAVLEQVDEARNGGSRCLDIMGDGEKEAFPLLHDALYLLVGSFQALSINLFFLSVSPDIP